MKLIINGSKLTIEDVKACYSGTINCYRADIEYSENWEGLTIEAIILPENEAIGERLAVINNQICLSRELAGKYYVGFIGYTIENEEKTYQTSTELKPIVFYKGAGEIEAKEVDELPPPTQWEKYIAEIQNVLNEANNLNIELVDNELTITHKDGSKTTTNVKGDKGDKGDAGSIKFIVVTELPTEDIDKNAIYMKQSTNPETQNTYEEFIYVNDEWEHLGSATVEVNLEDYVKNTDYAGIDKTGVVKLGSGMGLAVSSSDKLYIQAASTVAINNRMNAYNPIVPSNLEYAVKSVVGDHITLTQAEYDELVTAGTIDENTYYYIKEE